MSEILATKIVDDFERGQISRRQLVAQLMGLGAAVAASVGGSTLLAQQQADKAAATPPGQGAGQPRPGEPQPAAATTEPTFQATGLNHIAIDVVDVARSRDFYMKHLGLRVIRGDENAMFLGQGRDFFLTLFRRDRPGFHHYCYSIPRYEPDAAFERLSAAGLRPRREGARIYFPDPDGLTVQIAQQRAPA
jgi:catechol 2,3-dioxygenase-like lactoylglutathione lyase family enzyme